MNLFLRMLGGFAALVVAVVLAWVFVPPLRFAPVCAPVEAWAIDHGWVKVETADWGYLKLRAGADGRAALRELERHGATPQIRRTAAAVQLQYLAKGDVVWDVGPLKQVADHETRFDELRMPGDARTLPGAETVPADFWPDWQYRAGCLMPPSEVHAQNTCTFRMIDLNGDGQPEVVAEHKITGDDDMHTKPIVRYVWQVYVRKAGAWTQGPSVRTCAVDLATPDTAQPQVSTTAYDRVDIGGREVNFFSSTLCTKTDNTVTDPHDRFADIAGEATRIWRVPVLFPYPGYVPSSFMTALHTGAISLMATPDPISNVKAHATYAGLPPCFASHDILDCTAIVADLDHDGQEDVIIVSRERVRDIAGLHMATLFMNRQGHWQVVANRPVCMPDNLYAAKIHVTPGARHAAMFAGRPYLPDDGTDDCKAGPPRM